MLHLFLALVAGRLGLVLLPSGDAGTRSAIGVSDALAPALMLGLSVSLLGSVATHGEWIWMSGTSAVDAPLAGDVYERLALEWQLGGWALAALAGLAILRRTLGPAPLVPRHERLEATPVGLRLAAPLVWIAAVAAAVALERPSLGYALLVAWTFGAGLERLGVARAPRDAASLGVFAVLFGVSSQVDEPAALLAFALTFGAFALAAGWIRRADRRDLALAMIATAALPSPLFGALALFVIATSTRRPSIARGWFVGAGIAIAVRVALALLAFDTPATGEFGHKTLDLVGIVGGWILPCAAGAICGLPFTALARVRDVRRRIHGPSAA